MCANPHDPARSGCTSNSAVFSHRAALRSKGHENSFPRGLRNGPHFRGRQHCCCQCSARDCSAGSQRKQFAVEVGSTRRSPNFRHRRGSSTLVHQAVSPRNRAERQLGAESWAGGCIRRCGFAGRFFRADAHCTHYQRTPKRAQFLAERPTTYAVLDHHCRRDKGGHVSHRHSNLRV